MISVVADNCFSSKWAHQKHQSSRHIYFLATVSSVSSQTVAERDRCATRFQVTGGLRVSTISCVLKTTTQAGVDARSQPSDVLIGQIQSSLQGVTQSTNQIRVHEELSRAAGVRLDRAGASLLYKLRLHADKPLRVTSLAALLGVDVPTVTRKVQQLERLGYVAREPDPIDGRASLICLSHSGQETVDKFLAAHRDRLARLFDGWDDNDVRLFSALLERFSDSIRKDTEVSHGN
jgi:DNA-binding MarR family transcriptional regulator